MKKTDRETGPSTGESGVILRDQYEHAGATDLVLDDGLVLELTRRYAPGARAVDR